VREWIRIKKKWNVQRKGDHHWNYLQGIRPLHIKKLRTENGKGGGAARRKRISNM